VFGQFASRSCGSARRSWSSIGAVESLVYVAAVAIALGVAMLASLPAARRAAAVQPIIAMRAE
jgi:ABC-type antimicrobial peptide transport system permease subunit